MTSAVQDLLQKLVRIDSVNPALDIDAPGEAALADFVAAYCGNAGRSAIPTGHQRTAHCHGKYSLARCNRAPAVRPPHGYCPDSGLGWRSIPQRLSRGSDPLRWWCRHQGIASGDAGCAGNHSRPDTPRDDRRGRHRRRGASEARRQAAWRTLTPRFAGAIVGEPTGLVS